MRKFYLRREEVENEDAAKLMLRILRTNGADKETLAAANKAVSKATTLQRRKIRDGKYYLAKLGTPSKFN